MTRKPGFFRRVGDLPFHPVVFAVFPVASLYLRNLAKGFLGDAVAISAGLLGVCVVLWGSVSLFIRDKRRSAIVVSAFFVLFFTYGHIRSGFRGLLGRLNLLDRLIFLVRGWPADAGWMVVLAGLLALVCFVAIRRLRDVRSATQLLNLVATVLLVTSAYAVVKTRAVPTLLIPRLSELVQELAERLSGDDGSQLFLPAVLLGDPQDVGTYPTNEHRLFIQREVGSIQKHQGSAWLDTPSTPPEVTGSSPDIYYIILDGYQRADYLKEVYGYDSSEFLSFLAEKGFYVASQSTSNYPYTTHSLASSLNFMYVNDVAAQMETIHEDTLGIAMILDNRLFATMRQRGYRVVTFSSGYWWTTITKNVDVLLEPSLDRHQASDFQMGLAELTPLSVILGLRKMAGSVEREQVLYIFDHIADVADMPGPTLVFAHINSPHPPFRFGPNGEPIALDPNHVTRQEFAEAYRDQVAYTTKRAQQAIEEILERSSEPPIIIVQGDHGFCWGSYAEHLVERMSNLSVYFFPDQDYSSLYPSITPVNSFRVVLSDYFGEHYDLLQDRNYYSPENDPYNYTDVTDILSAGN